MSILFYATVPSKLLERGLELCSHSVTHCPVALASSLLELIDGLKNGTTSNTLLTCSRKCLTIGCVLQFVPAEA
jgi:hypothetical protein